MTFTTTSTPSITAAELGDRLAQGEGVSLLDVREDTTWGIEAPTLTTHHVPAADALADPDAVAAQLAGPVVVVCNRGLKAQAVADALRRVGVDARLLEGGTRAWLAELQARTVELGVSGLVVVQIQRPGRGCLSYLVASAGRALVVDPAPAADFYLTLACSLGVEITDVVDTHLHADHLSGARAIAAATGAALHLPAGAVDRGVAYADRIRTLHDGDEIALGDATVRALALPGHTTDMTGLSIADRALIGGDSLFADGIARPDLQRGDPDGARSMARTLHRTLHERVLSLPADTVLLPGHTHPGVLGTAVAPTLAEVQAQVSELSLGEDEFADALLADIPQRPANYEAVIAANAGTHPLDPELEAGGNSCSTL